MKISRKKIGIVFIFVILATLQTIAFATYQSVAASEMDEKEYIEEIVAQEASLTKEEQEILDLVNNYRKANGLNELKPLSILQDIAQMKGEDLVTNDYFAHKSEKLGTPFEMLQNNGVDFFTLEGENLAGTYDEPRAVELWIESDPHRRNILESRFKYTGICVINSSVYGKIFVQIFIGIN